MARGSILPTPSGNYLLPMMLPIQCWRGQVDHEWSLQPSIVRAEAALKQNGLSEELCRLVSEMRVQEFRKMLESTRRAEAWRSFSVPYPKKGMLKDGLFLDYRSVAQHYWMPTELVDFSNDAEVALFFACCTYDKDAKEYRPVDENWVSDHPYGSLYGAIGIMESTDHVPQDMQGLEFMSVQPFGRPVLQSGLALRPQCPGFFAVKHCFRHDPAFAEEIYEHFDGGRKIFPDEGLEWMTEEVDNILSSHSFSKAAFKRSCREIGIARADEKAVMKRLGESGYTIGPNAYRRSDRTIHEYDRGWEIDSYLRSMDFPYPTHTTIEVGENPDDLILSDMKPKMSYILGLYVMTFEML